MIISKILKLSVPAFILTFSLLSIVQVKSKLKMILLERFVPNGGWIEIIIISLYAAIIVYKMSDINKSEKWRIRTWTLFSIIFFSQLIFGLLGFEKFLMSGDLHLPVPAIILAGSVYRFELGFMVILLLSTIIISGPAWCSHLCYFGAIDNQITKIRKKRVNFNFSKLISFKIIFFFLILFGAFAMNVFGISTHLAINIGTALGIFGFLVIAISYFQRKMIHCTYWCPVGTFVVFTKYINPFRIKITNSCNSCMACLKFCNYIALDEKQIKKYRPGITCTYCGDCLNSCKQNSIIYKLFNLSPEKSRNIYLIITVSLHAIFMALARI